MYFLVAKIIFTCFINNMKISNTLKSFTIGCAMLSIPNISNKAFSQNTIIQDTIQTDDFVVVTAPPEGTSDKEVLAGAPNPNIKIVGEDKIARFVIDLDKNVLYKYNIQGKPEMAYMIASGKRSTPTGKGVRIVTHTETYPYKTAPISSKRRRSPKDYGPKIICVDIINPKDGTRRSTGEFIHGNNNFSSLGRYASHGCIRMDNEVIKELSGIVKRGDIIIIK